MAAEGVVGGEGWGVRDGGGGEGDEGAGEATRAGAGRGGFV